MSKMTDVGEPRRMVFGIGLPFSGTVNLSIALNYLGYRGIHFPHDTRTLQQLQNADYRLDIFSVCDAVIDLPVARYYRTFDRQFPGSKFILSVREMHAWLACIEEYLSRMPDSLEEVICRQGLCQMLQLDVQPAADAYNRHVQEVMDYFHGEASGQLLVMDICGGDGWDKLCPFLESAIPAAPFPYPLTLGDQQLLLPPASRNMNSYRELLLYLCDALSPRRILEWGPGESTILMATQCPNARLLTIEHDRGWFENIRQRTRGLENVEIAHIPHLEQFGGARGYVTYPLRRLLRNNEELRSYDLIFVDGRSRCDCLTVAFLLSSLQGLVVLHDSNRPSYLEGLNLFPDWIQYWDIVTAVAGQNDLSILKEFKRYPGVRIRNAKVR